MQCLGWKSSLHLPAHIHPPPVNVCGTSTRWPFAALRNYSAVDPSALLTLATTHYTPITLCLCSHWSTKHFNPSLSTRRWRQSQMINQFASLRPDTTTRLRCLHTFPIILHGRHVEYWACGRFWAKKVWLLSCGSDSSRLNMFAPFIHFFHICTEDDADDERETIIQRVFMQTKPPPQPLHLQCC